METAAAAPLIAVLIAVCLSPALTVWVVLRFSSLGRQSEKLSMIQADQETKRLEIEDRKVKLEERKMELIEEKTRVEHELARTRMEQVTKGRVRQGPPPVLTHDQLERGGF